MPAKNKRKSARQIIETVSVGTEEIPLHVERITVRPIKRSTILRNIADHLRGELQWSRSGHWDNAWKYAQQAIALIELLEVDDCGSVGGFDRTNELVRLVPHEGFNRFWTVSAKYKQMMFAKELLPEFKKFKWWNE